MVPPKEQDPATEAWSLIWQIMQSNKPRMFRLASELDLAPMQLHALRVLEPEREVPMRALAKQLFCDPSNVTGIVDRLEARGLIERREDEGDRRVKILALTPAGVRVRQRAMRQMEEPPPEIAGLPRTHQIALRDALRKAKDRQAQNGEPARPVRT
ncbi:MAG TPA: MarR family transcriptional regulator [Thermoleophilaceae bacterium]|nr:MarR family transcriptional regulator [Thermoleophilaceae bacterium]